MQWETAIKILRAAGYQSVQVAEDSWRLTFLGQAHTSIVIRRWSLIALAQSLV